jgi:nucleoid-associated protein YgaU
MPPSFDVVRIAPDGNAVIAGRATPGARVTVKDGDKELGSVTADNRGEWVLLPTAPLPPGGRTLTLGAKLGEGPSIAAERDVVLVVPERQRDVAGQPATQPTQSLALSVPSAGASGASTVMQAPPAAPGTAAPPPPRPIAAPTPIQPQGQITLDVVDYDKTGRVILSGKAQPEGDVRVYLDNKMIGETPSGSGQWKLTPTDDVAVGNYTLRADLLGTGGRVIARVELPFQRAAITPEALAGGKIVVQPGHSLWRIARQAYGGGVLYTLIYTANAEQIRDPDLIYPGQVFQVPTRTN